jgi:hypothetical protein
MKQPFLQMSAWCGSVLALLLCGCAKVNDTGLRLVSTKVDAWLVVNAQQLTGTVLLVPDRSGRVSFSADKGDNADKGDITQCSGSLHYNATNTAAVDLHCNEGTQVALQVTLLSEARGYGYGSTAQGPASIAFGLPEEDARAFMGRAAPAVPAPPQ